MKRNYLNALRKASIEDINAGKPQARLLSFPIKAKRKDGEDIHKLPPYYPIIGEYEKEFKKEYSSLIKKVFFTKFEKILKG